MFSANELEPAKDTATEEEPNKLLPKHSGPESAISTDVEKKQVSSKFTAELIFNFFLNGDDDLMYYNCSIFFIILEIEVLETIVAQWYSAELQNYSTQV